MDSPCTVIPHYRSMLRGLTARLFGIAKQATKNIPTVTQLFGVLRRCSFGIWRGIQHSLAGAERHRVPLIASITQLNEILPLVTTLGRTKAGTVGTR